MYADITVSRGVDSNCDYCNVQCTLRGVGAIKRLDSLYQVAGSHVAVSIGSQHFIERLAVVFVRDNHGIVFSLLCGEVCREQLHRLARIAGEVDIADFGLDCQLQFLCSLLGSIALWTAPVGVVLGAGP